MRLLAATLTQSLDAAGAKLAAASRDAEEKRAVFRRELGKMHALIAGIKAARAEEAAAAAAAEEAATAAAQMEVS